MQGRATPLNADPLGGARGDTWPAVVTAAPIEPDVAGPNKEERPASDAHGAFMFEAVLLLDGKQD